MSEPAIQVRRKGKGTQVWTIEKLENKLVDMRDHYRDWKEDTEEMVRKQRIRNRKCKKKKKNCIIQVFLFFLFFFSITRQTVLSVTHSTRRKRTTT